MAGRIPETTRRRLASSVVGTPGQDLSLSRIFATTGEVLGQAEREKAKQEQARRVKTQTALDTTSASRGVAGFNSELNRIGRDARTQEEYDTTVKESFQRKLQGFDNDEARAQFSKKASTLMVRKGDQFFNRNEDKKLEIIQVGLNNSVEELAAETEDIFGDPGLTLDDKLLFFASNLDVAQDTINGAKDALGAEAHSNFSEETAQTLARTAALSLLETNPEQVDEFLDEINAAGILDKEEISQIKDDAADYEKKIARSREAATKIRQSTVEDDFTNRALDEENPPSLSEIDSAVLNGDISESYARKLKAFNKSSRAIFAQDNPATYGELQTQFSAITKTKETRGGRKITVNKDTSLEQLSLFRQGVLESMEAGEISKETGKLWMNRISPKFNEKIDELLKNINNVDIEIDNAFDMTSRIITDPAELQEANMRLQKDLMQGIDSFERDKGSRASLQEMRGILQGVTKEFVHSNNPDRSVYALGEVIQRKGRKWIIYDFTSTGSPMLSSNLDRKIHLDTDDIIDEKGTTRKRNK